MPKGAPPDTINLPGMEEYIRKGALAEEVGMHERTIMRKVAEGKIRYVNFANAVYVHRGDFTNEVKAGITTRNPQRVSA